MSERDFDYEIAVDRTRDEMDDLRARCARLEAAAINLLNYYENSLNAGPGPRPRTEAQLLHDLRTALSDTGKPSDAEFVRIGKAVHAAKQKAAADMRDRAANYAADKAPEWPETKHGDGYQKACDDIAEAIRALPLTEGNADERI